MASDIGSTSQHPLFVDIEMVEMGTPPRHSFDTHASIETVGTSVETVGTSAVTHETDFSFGAPNYWTWRRILMAIALVGLIAVVAITAILFLVLRQDHLKTHKLHPHPECQLSLTVSQDGKSNFTTISDALDACPSSNSSSFKICILVRAGEYNEKLNIADEKMYVMLIGEGAEKTIITSNSSLVVGTSILPSATLTILGEGFIAQDLTIENKNEYGLAVENFGDKTVFFQCTLKAFNATLHMEGIRQFYQSCTFHGKTSLVSGFADSFFQRCEFFSMKSYPQDRTFFFTQTPPRPSHYYIFIFHICSFHVVPKFNNTFRTTYLGGDFGDFGNVVVLQSSLDSSIGGYYLGGPPPNTCLYKIYENTRNGEPIKNIPSYILSLPSVESAAEFSLRGFMDVNNWIPPGIDYDLGSD
ncbi:Probable pectinesterase/pectinesterase inhibitor 17 [Striga hermonthica]|uniref:Probable pectinesterase/pectinesterase inhibitor 17 n=1 Tax=Striga hermonthica TaxID=68872 RepID=A0A9N7NBU7_STRHE|nr:Probable pectinesterase/pectinesterase inhibitor 17 [Striga hermonthica]